MEEVYELGVRSLYSSIERYLTPRFTGGQALLLEKLIGLNH
jgi:hypothetical protein